MKILFHAWGDEGISATHKTTFEITKDDFVTAAGDCIIGISSDFDGKKLKEFVKNYSRVRITLRTGALKEIVYADTNSAFDDDRELVVRMGEHVDKRTFAIHADKSAKYLDREFVRALKAGSPMGVDIEAVE